MQQRQGPPPEERFLRVCKVLAMEKDQRKHARKLYDGMIAARDSVLAREESEETPSDTARAGIAGLEEKFKASFSALLNEEQKKKMQELQDAGTLGDRWW